jgi:hypothetical protein
MPSNTRRYRSQRTARSVKMHIAGVDDRREPSGRTPSPLSIPPLAPLEGHIAPGVLASLHAADLLVPPEAA